MYKESKKIAILGNGQLASMLQESVASPNLQVDSFDLPCVDKSGTSSKEEIDKYCTLVKHYDSVTYEIENISVALLDSINKITPVFPSIDAISTAQDRLSEKNMFKSLSIRTNDFLPVYNYGDLENASKVLGYPFVLKTRRFGYDGKGQAVISSSKDLKRVMDALPNRSLIAEEFVKFDYEVSQIASRDANGNIVYYPLVRNEHVDGILRETHLLNFPSILTNSARNVMEKMLKHWNYVGTCTIEFFVIGDELYANEIAPRVHNSGHWSINGSEVSQFKNHMLAVTGQDVSSPLPLSDNVMMINLIGEVVPRDIKCNSITHVKDYCKSLRSGRKMGHINIVSQDSKSFISARDYVYANIQAKKILNLP